MGNDNILFNVSQTIGDHVMCTQAKGAVQMGLAAATPSKCAAFDAEPNLYGPGGVDTGPQARPARPEGFEGREIHARGELGAHGLGSLAVLPNTATGHGEIPAWTVVVAALLVLAAGWFCARWLPAHRRASV
jgi:hypothetical protein